MIFTNLTSHNSRRKHNLLTRQTRNSASGNGNRNPERILRNIDPGIANDCKLPQITVKENKIQVTTEQNIRCSSVYCTYDII